MAGKFESKWTPSTALEVVKEGQRFQREFGGSDSWTDYANYYRGDFAGLDYFYNLFYIFVRSSLPSIYYRDPHVNVVPMKTFGPDPNPTRQIGSLVLQSIDNILLRKMRIKSTIRDVIFDTMSASRGLVKIGFSSEYGLQKPLEQGGDKDSSEHNVDVKNGMPWVSRVAPIQSIVPFGSRRLRNIPWFCHLILRYTEDVKNTQSYKLAKTFSGTHVNLLQNWLSTNRLNELGEDLMDLTEIHEFYDMRVKELMAYVPTGDVSGGKAENIWIREPSKDSLMSVLGGEIPFEDLVFNEDPDFFWGPSDFRQLEPLQIEINETGEQARRHRQISLLRFLIQKGMIDPGELQKFLSAENPGVAIEIGGNLETAIKMLQPHNPPDLAAWKNMNREDARELTGVGKQQAGITTGGRKTAREITAAQLGYDNRVGEKRDAVADFIQRVMTKVNKIIGGSWTIADVVPVVGVDGAMYWVEFNAELLRGDYGVKIDADELSPITMNMRKQEILQMAQTLGGAGAPIDYLLRKLVSLYDDMDLQSILPPGNNGQVMPAGAFASQQAQLPMDQRNAGVSTAFDRLRNASPMQEPAALEGMGF